MKSVLKFVLVLLLASAAMLALSRHVAALYAVPCDGLAPSLGRGHRVVVVRTGHRQVAKGSVVVFRKGDAEYMGRVAAVPGDTIRVGRERYVLPLMRRCPRCGSTNCRHYLVEGGGQRVLVRQNFIIGTARWSLFPFHRINP